MTTLFNFEYLPMRQFIKYFDMFRSVGTFSTVDVAYGTGVHSRSDVRTGARKQSIFRILHHKLLKNLR